MRLRCAVAIGSLLVTSLVMSPARADIEFASADRPIAEFDDRHVGERPGLQIGARAGFGGGSGSVYRGLSVNDDSKAMVPFTADLGVRLVPELFIGAYGSYAYVIPRTSSSMCPDGYTCAVKNFRVGLEMDVHLLPNHALDPYLGVFGGYELLNHQITGQTQLPGSPSLGTIDGATRDRGWEIGLQAGSDMRLVRVLAVGPYVSASIGRYINRTGTTQVRNGEDIVDSTNAASVDHAYHQLYMVGLRATLNTL